jgi:hypothetical protein
MRPAPRALEIRREDANRPTTAPGSSREGARPPLGKASRRLTGYQKGALRNLHPRNVHPKLVLVIRKRGVHRPGISAGQCWFS